nr:calcium-transporting ATPase 9, plasma membrane-type-like isoform X1 [Ipomoea batatas]
MTSDGDGKGGREDNVTTTSKLNFPFQAVSSSTDAMPDLEAGKADVACASESVDDGSSDPFDIANTKKASVQALKRWRQAALVLNASRRFRYTLDLKKAEQKDQRRRMIRAHAQVVRAALLFKLAGQRAIVLGTAVTPPVLSGDYGISLEQLVSITRNHDISVKCLSEKLKTNLNTGIIGDEDELSKRRNTFGSNTYPTKKGRSFLRFLWEAWQDLTLIILIIAAVASLGLGIETEGLSTGWYDGGSIFFAVFLVIFVTATSDYRQSLQFQNLNEEKRNIKVEVRRLSACETMGSATTICSDKTGTLTLNQMTVVNAYVGKKKIDPPEDGSQVPPVVCRLLDESIVLNTAGSVFTSKDGSGIEVSGSPTEKAILTWGVKLGMKFNVVRSGSVVLHISPFNSTKKRGGVAVRGLQNNSQVRAHWKGAAEIILASCTAYYDSNGCLQPIENEKDFFKGAIQDMAARSLRCVAIAYRSCDTDKVPTDEEQLSEWNLPEDDLILLAIVGIKDPCRPGVKDAVRLCTNAGVKVRMVTGDNIQTAKAIALECGILSSDADITADDIIDGKTFRELPEKEREQVAQRISVMGRSSPSDKLLLVQTLRKQGDVVAVTGDGTNDAPALHEADIGLAMGIQGTEVAKESSDIIILDDNFASVVKVVRWGRSVYANIQKFIQFQLTVNVAALVINVVAAISSGDVPLNTLLWVNLIMDTLGALALATEPPTDHLMHRPPVGRRQGFIFYV